MAWALSEQQFILSGTRQVFGTACSVFLKPSFGPRCWFTNCWIFLNKIALGEKVKQNKRPESFFYLANLISLWAGLIFIIFCQIIFHNFMRPENLKTKIFLDSGDPNETREAIKILGFLDGQTTNPTLMARNPEAMARLERGEKFSQKEVYDFYRNVVEKISAMIPGGSISIEVYADAKTPAKEMLAQAKEMASWISNAHIKLPITIVGLEAASEVIKAGARVNMTLCFSQVQAAAVYAATRGAKKGDVFVSPFVGRLDDHDENGMDLIKNILKMYEAGDGHVEALVASVRNIEHFLWSLALGADIITAPLKILKEWTENGSIVSSYDYAYDAKNLKEITYQDININGFWQNFNLFHELTDKGLERFSQDWNALIG